VIDYVYVGLSEDKEGRNGICAAFAPGIGGTPMVTASDKVLEYFKDQIDELAKMLDGKIKIVRFTRAEVVAESK
jgi:hypothetical protein